MANISLTGTATHQNGNRIPNLQIVVSERQLRGKKNLAQQPTDSRGIFNLTFNATSASLFYFVEALDDAGNVLASEGAFPAKSGDRKVNLVLQDSRFKGDVIFKTRELELKNLSALFRHAALARWTGMDIPNLLTTIGLCGINPFDGEAETHEFLRRTGFLEASGFSLAELDYLLRHRFAEPSGTAPAAADIQVFLEEIEAMPEINQSTLAQKFSAAFGLSAKAAPEKRRQSCRCDGRRFSVAGCDGRGQEGGFSQDEQSGFLAEKIQNFGRRTGANA